MKKSNIKEILDRYEEKQETYEDVLRKLDKKVSQQAKTFAYVFGSVFSLVLGSGMSLIMTDIGEFVGAENTFCVGIILGLIGIIGVSAAYPLYKKVLNLRRKRYAGEIIELGNKIINGEKQNDRIF